MLANGLDVIFIRFVLKIIMGTDCKSEASEWGGNGNSNIMRNRIIITFFFLFTVNLFGQNISLIKDSILNTYKRSGFCSANFISIGENEYGIRKGFWKTYDWSHDYAYIVKDAEQNPISGNYWFYREGEYLDGKKNGKWDYYVIEDITFKKILHKQLNFNNGVYEGEYKYFHLNKKIAHKGVMVNKKREGVVNTYYENGKLKHKVFYKNNLLEGKVIGFYSNGKIEKESNYKNDKLDGVYHYYHDNGQLWIEKIYEKGLLMNVTANYDFKGNKRDKGTLKNGNGTLKFYNKRDILIITETYKEGFKISEEIF